MKKLDYLTLLADKYRCDKGSIKHNYTKIYDSYFCFLKNKYFKLLEIGFGKGASVKMWLDYFPNATIYCADIRKELPEDALLTKHIHSGKFKFFSVDQSDVKQLANLYDEEQFEIIIDDGSHVAEDQQFSFGCLFPYLLHGGLYIIEDLNCRRSHSKRFGVESEKTIKVLEECKSRYFNSNVLTKDQIVYINRFIGKIEIYNNKIAFIKKV